MQAVFQRKPLEPAIALQSMESSAVRGVLAASFHLPHCINHCEAGMSEMMQAPAVGKHFPLIAYPGQGPALQWQEGRSYCFYRWESITYEKGRLTTICCLLCGYIHNQLIVQLRNPVLSTFRRVQ